jgi:hypothetical protein
MIVHNNLDYLVHMKEIHPRNHQNSFNLWNFKKLDRFQKSWSHLRVAIESSIYLILVHALIIFHTIVHNNNENLVLKNYTHLWNYYNSFNLLSFKKLKWFQMLWINLGVYFPLTSISKIQLIFEDFFGCLIRI